MEKRFEGKVALVTAAGAGIGAATAEAFARHVARVMLSDINVEAGAAMADKLRSAGHDASFLRADATVEEEVLALVTKPLAVCGGCRRADNTVGHSLPQSA